MVKIINQIYKRFHIIDNRNTILLHNLKRLNQLQNELSIIKIDITENRLFYTPYQKEEMENSDLEKQIGINTLASRCIEDIEFLIVETGIVVDMYFLLEDEGKTEMTAVFSEKYVPFIHGISNLESLFLSELSCIQELLGKIKLFGKTLQNVLDFEIQIENVNK